MTAVQVLDQSLGIDGHHVLLTGAGGGIGHALATVFRAAGARVTGADRSLVSMEGLELDHRLAFDITDRRTTADALANHQAKAGCPDILINNAGHTRAETMDQVDQAVWDAELDLNLTGAYAVTSPILNTMRKRGTGSIVFISSVNGLAHFGNPAYSAAKAGLIAYAKAVAVECGQNGVRANVVCPGSVRTPAWDHRFARNPDLLETIRPHYPLGRMVTPEEVARAVLFLASPMASGITGAVLPVDAGLMAGNRLFITQVLEGH